MKALTVRNVDRRLAKALDEERKRRGTSLNRTVLDLLRRALGLDPDQPSNGLSRLAGTWSEDEHRELEEAMAPFEQVDEELWS